MVPSILIAFITWFFGKRPKGRVIPLECCRYCNMVAPKSLMIHQPGLGYFCTHEERDAVMEASRWL